MNKHIKLVEKWLNDKNSVTQEELEQNRKDAAYAAYAYATATADVEYVVFAATATADAAYADAAYWVKKYHKLKGE